MYIDTTGRGCPRELHKGTRGSGGVARLVINLSTIWM
jgi:hypothetical protein